MSTATTLLTKHALVETGDFAVEDVECRCGSARWSPPEQSLAYGIVFVRSGCFHRLLNGIETFVDSTVAYFERPGDEQQISHLAGGDSCTAVYLSARLLASVHGGEEWLPDRTVRTTPALDLRHRLLLGLVGSGSDEAEAAEAVVALVADLLDESDPKPVASGRPATALARRRAVAVAREVLCEHPTAGVLELARRAAVSPHHLSRVFKAETGETISRYRNRLRVRLALERLAEGEPCLARLAADLGFSDQAHLSRVVRAELGDPASHLRAQLMASGLHSGGRRRPTTPGRAVSSSS